jgi:hypothetical protein
VACFQRHRRVLIFTSTHCLLHQCLASQVTSLPCSAFLILLGMPSGVHISALLHHSYLDLVLNFMSSSMMARISVYTNYIRRKEVTKVDITVGTFSNSDLPSIHKNVERLFIQYMIRTFTHIFYFSSPPLHWFTTSHFLHLHVYLRIFGDY